MDSARGGKNHILPEYSLEELKAVLLCGAMLAIRKNPKNAIRKIALNNNRSESQATDMRYKV